MKKFIAISITICLLISFLPMNIVKSSTITDIKEIQTFAVPKGDFIGSATLYEMNFYEGEFNSKYIFLCKECVLLPMDILLLLIILMA